MIENGIRTQILLVEDDVAFTFEQLGQWYEQAVRDLPAEAIAASIRLEVHAFEHRHGYQTSNLNLIYWRPKTRTELELGAAVKQEAQTHIEFTEREELERLQAKFINLL